MSLIERIWNRLTTTSYARWLECQVAREHAEMERLRAENRALLNSILGIAGVPPIVTPNVARGAEDIGNAEAREGHGRLATPARRPSWHQAMRELEIRAARKKD
jgi:hypothetical protein